MKTKKLFKLMRMIVTKVKKNYETSINMMQESFVAHVKYEENLIAIF